MPVSNISQLIKDHAYKIGIDLIGFAAAEKDQKDEERLRRFINEGRHGRMYYLDDFQKRVNPNSILPGAASVIVIALNYYRPKPETPKQSGAVASYAYGRDYHKVIKSFLKKLDLYIKKIAPEAKTVICTDTAPIIEKSYAVKAGLGFIGKNTTLITPKFGSYVLLGEIVTNLKLEYDKPNKGGCGTCKRCVNACPTKALLEPYKMDAVRCVSYLTIENKQEIPKVFHARIGNRVFGCDTCQEVCPYNISFAKETRHKDFQTPIAGAHIPLNEILSIKDDRQYLKRFAGSPLMRAKRKGLQRNAKIALQNTPEVL